VGERRISSFDPTGSALAMLFSLRQDAGGKRWVTRATGLNRKSSVEPPHADIMPVEFALLTLGF
jgi:hypothetical protein